MLASELHMPVSAITDDLRWIAAIGSEDAEWFLVKVHEAFVRIPSGFSFGSGQGPFDDCERLDEIETVGGLIAVVENHVQRLQP